jgi:phosphatidylinositol dimannoside acyltransferase
VSESQPATGRSPDGVTAPTPPPGAPLSPFERVVFRLMLAGLWLARRLPDKPIYRVAFAIGAGLYLLLPERRRLVRANLERVVRWLVENDMANPRVVRAAGDPRSLDRLVRATFGHWAVTYAEAALGPRYSGEQLARRFVRAYPEASAAALSIPAPGDPGPIHLAMHFGSVDLSAIYGARVGKLPLTGPMEFVESPLARAYFDRVRFEMGVTIVPLAGAAEALTGALVRGEAVGIVADRNIVGRGVAATLFGGPVRLPIGPAMLAVQTGAPLFLEAIERTGPGAWLGHTIALRAEPGASRREATRQIMEQEARAMERVIARAPEQWTTLFFPIWEDDRA